MAKHTRAPVRRRRRLVLAWLTERGVGFALRLLYDAAVKFRKLLESRRIDAPSPLVEAYGDELKGYARAGAAGRAAA